MYATKAKLIKMVTTLQDRVSFAFWQFFVEILFNKTQKWNFHFISIYTNAFYLLSGGHVEFKQPFLFYFLSIDEII